MLNIKKICWGMLGIITIGWFEPAVRADVPEIKSVIRGIRVAVEPSLASVLSGNSIPTSIKLKDLTPEWRAMGTNGQFELGNFQAFVGVFGGGSLATSYYTKGQTVSVGSETYIVAYSLLSLVDKVSPEMSLNLSLLNLKTIGSMSNIRVFETIAETQVLEKQLASFQIANIFGGTKPDGVKDLPVEEPVVKPDEVQPKPSVRKKVRSTKKYRRRSIRRSIRRNINRSQ
jgi:acyl-CoA thioesterase